MTQNQIAYQNYLEAVRTNKAREAETYRTNLANEDLRRRELEETGRHNLAAEAELYRSNYAREYETNRSNLAREFETARSNRANEALGYAQLAVTDTHYKNQDWVSAYNAKETSQHNREQEARAQFNSLVEYNKVQASTKNAQTAASATRYAAEARNAAAVVQSLGTLVGKLGKGR